MSSNGTIAITELPNSRLALTAPFHPSLSARAKAIGGRWDPTEKLWHFDPRDRERVETIAAELFGWAKTSSGELVTVRIDAGAHERGKVIRFAGREVAYRPGRDNAVRLAEGVVIIAGRFPAGGGSVAYPKVNGAGVILEVRDLPAEALDIAVEGTYELVGGTDARVTQLETERAELVARLADIEAELAQLKAGA